MVKLYDRPVISDRNTPHQKPRKLLLPILRNVLTFIGCAFLSGALVSGIGMHLWFSSGQNPDNSGGTLIFFYGGILSGLLGLLARIFTTRRAVLYGLTFFMWNTVLMMILMV